MIKVVCALIQHRGKILIAQRSETMTNPLLWEFPGGKMQANESVFEAIIRECYEELNLRVMPLKKGKSIKHIYPHISIELVPVFCQINEMNIQLIEHKNYVFIAPEKLKDFELSAADLKIISAHKAEIDKTDLF